MIAALFVVFLLVLFLPFLVRKVGENLEPFLFIMGVAAVTVSAQWAWSLATETLIEPIGITVAVLAAGILFKLLKFALRKAVGSIISAMGLKAFAFCMVTVLGLVSSVVTAVISALILVEVIDCMRLDRKDEIRLVVISCFAIGLGAALTPLGEPLSTIVIAKLKGEPYNAGFWYLFSEFWHYIVPGVVAFGVLAAVGVKKGSGEDSLKEDREEGIKDILLRTARTYVFVMALILLGTGFKPIIDAHISQVPAWGLYWINTVSAILDNATLAAAEVGPTMLRGQLDFALLGLLLAGGMLIPGNIPNIIAAGKLGIKSKEWMKIGLPIGVCAMALYFAVLTIVGR